MLKPFLGVRKRITCNITNFSKEIPYATLTSSRKAMRKSEFISFTSEAIQN